MRWFTLRFDSPPMTVRRGSLRFRCTTIQEHSRSRARTFIWSSRRAAEDHRKVAQFGTVSTAAKGSVCCAARPGLLRMSVNSLADQFADGAADLKHVPVDQRQGEQPQIPNPLLLFFRIVFLNHSLDTELQPFRQRVVALDAVGPGGYAAA